MINEYKLYLDFIISRDVLLRRDAAIALSTFGPGILPALFDLLKEISAHYYEEDDRMASDIARAIGLSHYPEVAVPSLVEILKTCPDPLARKEAALALRIMRSRAKNSVTSLAALLADEKDPRVRRDIALALGSIGEVTTLVARRLTKLLEAAEAQVRVAGVRALGMLAPQASSVRKALADSSKDVDEAVRIHAAAASAVIENRTEAAIPDFLASLRQQNNPEVRFHTILALRVLKPGKSAVQSLIAVLGDPIASIRREAASILGGIGKDAQDAVAYLVGVLNDSNVGVREAAAEALWRIGPPANEAVPALVKALEQPHSSIRELAAFALEAIGSKSDLAISALQIALNDQNPAVQIRAMVALMTLAPNHDSNAKSIVQLLGSEYSEVRLIAAAMLHHIGEKASTALPVLKSMMNDEEPWVCAEASRALQAFNDPSLPKVNRILNMSCGFRGAAAYGSESVRSDLIVSLIQALKDTRSKPGKASDVIGKLENLGASAREAVPLLLEFDSKDQPPLIRFKAIMALQNIDPLMYDTLLFERCPPWGSRWRARFNRSGALGDDLSVGGTTWQDKLEAWKPATVDLLAEFSTVYEELTKELSAVSHSFSEILAKRLEPALNAKVTAMPQDTYEEKKELSRWVNEELRQFDLAIKCPKTGMPSILLAGPGNHPEIGRFILEHKTSDGKKVRSVSTPELPHLDLMEANPRREAIKEWNQRIGRPGHGASLA